MAISVFSVFRYPDFTIFYIVIIHHDTSHAGVSFVRRSKWSEWFLDTWWNQTSFIQFGSTKSGDNAALKHLIDHLSAEEMQAHVRIAKMQCLFNSYSWVLTWKSGWPINWLSLFATGRWTGLRFLETQLSTWRCNFPEVIGWRQGRGKFWAIKINASPGNP